MCGCVVRGCTCSEFAWAQESKETGAACSPKQGVAVVLEVDEWIKTVKDCSSNRTTWAGTDALNPSTPLKIPSLTLWSNGNDKSKIRRQEFGLFFFGITPKRLNHLYLRWIIYVFIESFHSMLCYFTTVVFLVVTAAHTRCHAKWVDELKRCDNCISRVSSNSNLWGRLTATVGAGKHKAHCR